MPIEGEVFQKTKFEPQTKRKGGNQNKILLLLSEDTTKAFTQGEILKLTGIKHQAAANNALHALKQKGKVECRIVDKMLHWKYADL